MTRMKNVLSCSIFPSPPGLPTRLMSSLAPVYFFIFLIPLGSLSSRYVPVKGLTNDQEADFCGRAGTELPEGGREKTVCHQGLVLVRDSPV